MSTAVSMGVSNELQGIGSVLGSSEYQRSKTAASLRRTLSADMSSKKWLSKNGFCPLKRIASSEEFQTVTGAEEPARRDTPVWNSKKEDEPPGQTDIWSLIVSQKSSTDPTAYVHPLAKRNRSLSQQSLEICTESLGSETGSDVFSSVSPSETSDEEPEEEKEEEEVEEETPVVAVNYNSYPVKKSTARSFPPPLSSLSQSGLHMRSRRVDGRLVMEAVPVQVPSQNYFHAQREGGRLLLTFTSPKPDETINSDAALVKIQEDEEVEEEEMFNEVEDDDEEEVEDEFEDEEEEEEEEYDSEEENHEPVANRGIVLGMTVSEPSPTKKMPTGVINVHRSALMVNKLMGLTNIDPSWSSKLGKLVDDDDQTPLTQSLPMVTRLVPPSTAASSFNPYNYCWRTKSGSVAPPTVCSHPLSQNPQPLNNKNNNYLLPKNLNPQAQAQQEMVLMRGNKADYLVPVFKGCKEPRRSLFIWEPHCIAT